MKKIILFPLLIIIVLFNSCEKEITGIELDFVQKIAMHSEFSNTNNVKVFVSKNIPLFQKFDSAGMILKTAQVTLFENNNPISTGNYNADGNFYFNYKPISGKSYKIEAKYPQYPTCFALVSMPNALVANSSFIDSIGLDEEGFKLGELTINFNDPSERNYYELKVDYFDASIQQWFVLTPNSSDPIFSNNNKKNDGSFLFSDATFNGENKTLKILVKDGTFFGDYKFNVSLKSIPYDYYLYLRQIEEIRENNSSGTSFNPVILKTNVENGLGMIGTVSQYVEIIEK